MSKEKFMTAMRMAYQDILKPKPEKQLRMEDVDRETQLLSLMDGNDRVTYALLCLTGEMERIANALQDIDQNLGNVARAVEDAPDEA